MSKNYFEFYAKLTFNSEIGNRKILHKFRISFWQKVSRFSFPSEITIDDSYEDLKQNELYDIILRTIDDDRILETATYGSEFFIGFFPDMIIAKGIFLERKF